MVMRKNPCHDTMTPAGQLIDRARLTTWERPLKGNETPEEAYARGWADALAKYEADKYILKNFPWKINDF